MCSDSTRDRNLGSEFIMLDVQKADEEKSNQDSSSIQSKSESKSTINDLIKLLKALQNIKLDMSLIKTKLKVSSRNKNNSIDHIICQNCQVRNDSLLDILAGLILLVLMNIVLLFLQKVVVEYIFKNNSKLPIDSKINIEEDQIKMTISKLQEEILNISNDLDMVKDELNSHDNPIINYSAFIPRFWDPWNLIALMALIIALFFLYPTALFNRIIVLEIISELHPNEVSKLYYINFSLSPKSTKLVYFISILYRSNDL
ncbi:hypothetical protein DFJ63DRAFT_334285 [Scheffersomyces coipomensis]|uniref:uncharacterized protein n=1 Tax=Scheffersomyces coipomensis TaxID=1788519 RepID=UPI00315CFFBD